MNDLSPFQFDGRNVRLVDRNGETWFVAADVARELGYRMASDLTRTLDDDERGTHTMRTPSGDQDLAIISEPGLYRAIIQRRANKKHDEALLSRIARFQRWVFHDILPSIRKTGSYTVPAAPALDLDNPKLLQGLLLEHVTKRIEAESRAAAAEAAVEVAKPKAAFFDAFANADGLYGLQNAARVLGEPPNKFIGWLKTEFLFYQGGNLVPKVQYRNNGAFEVKATMVDDKARYQSYVTPRGLQYLAKRLGKNPDLFGLGGSTH